MSWSIKPTTMRGYFSRAALFLILSLALLLGTQQVGSLFVKQAPAAGNRAARANYHLVDCDQDGSGELRLVHPLPDTRYLYNERYGWFDTTHFDAGNPAKVIADVEAAVSSGGGIISISQSVRGGITGYTGHYLVSGDVAPEQINGVSLGIYMDWSIRFEAWQGRLPRGLVGPFTSFAIEDLPTQYIGFIEDATGLQRSVLFACFLGEVKAAEAPPHLWPVTEPHTVSNGPVLPRIKRLTNETFQPMILTQNDWETVSWPEPLRRNPIPSNYSTWLFEMEETWYLNQTIP
jgi:hypothetical protein